MSDKWRDAEHPTPGAKAASPDCLHWGHKPGEWFYACCARSGAPGGCDACELDL